jgi:GTPase
MAGLPRVVLVGRTNVGKSTLFNRLAVDAKSLTYDYAGITRDFISDVVSWSGKDFELIDTGGVSLRKTQDTLLRQVRAQALSLIDTAAFILFVCDATVGILPEDREIARVLQKKGIPVLLVVNKVDTQISKEHVHEFSQLGFDLIVPLSAQHGTGIGELLHALVAHLPQTVSPEEVEVKCRVMLLGKPNVGKSSLMNLLLKQERTLVSPQAGTTREAITERLRFYKEDFQLTDTPGLRRKRSIEDPIEKLMAKSALGALEHTDIALLLVDASQGSISDQELKLAFYAFTKLYKGLLILFNKDDLLDEDSKYQLEHSCDAYRYFLKKIVTLPISCITERNIGKIMPLVDTLCKRYSQTLPEQEITILFHEHLERKPLFHKTNRLILYKVYQVATAPITLLLTVNYTEWFGPSQLAFFESIVRKNFEVQGVPIKFVVRKKS